MDNKFRLGGRRVLVGPFGDSPAQTPVKTSGTPKNVVIKRDGNSVLKTGGAVEVKDANSKAQTAVIPGLGQA